jgi:hypothetical protein
VRSIRRPLLRFGQVGPHCPVLVVEAMACLLLARLASIFVPFPRLAQHIGAFVPPVDARAAQAQTATTPGLPRTSAGR